LFHTLGENNLLLKFCKDLFSIKFATWKFSIVAKKILVGTCPSSFSCSIVGKNTSLWACDLKTSSSSSSCSIVDKNAFLQAYDSRTFLGSSSHLVVSKNAFSQACDFQTCGGINISTWNTHSYLHTIGDSFICSNINSISILRSSKLGTSSCSNDICEPWIMIQQIVKL